MSKSVKEIALIASEWWADKVVSPKFDNGDSDLDGFLATMMASQLVEPVADEKREKFITHLSQHIEGKLNDDLSSILSVDYGPCQALSEATEFAGISVNNFPWKTNMWVDKDHVSASYGYFGKVEILYANKSYWRDRIESAQIGIKGYKNGEYLTYIKDEEERKEEVFKNIAELEESIEEYKQNLLTAEE